MLLNHGETYLNVQQPSLSNVIEQGQPPRPHYSVIPTPIVILIKIILEYFKVLKSKYNFSIGSIPLFQLYSDD